MTKRKLSATVVAAAVALTISCGYHQGAQADLIPKSAKTIAVPPFRNRTIQYKLNDSIPNAIIREFKSRTKYQIVNDVHDADLVLEGEIASATVSPTVSDPGSGKATAIGVSVLLNLRLIDRRDNKILYQKTNQEFHDSYEISEDPSKYIDEGDFAWARVSRDVAMKTVSLLLEAF